MRRQSAIVMVLLLAGSALLACSGCGEEDRSSSSDDMSASSAPPDTSPEPRLMFADTPPWEPVWPEGTAFSDTSRDFTVVARTAGLEAIVQRNRQVFGDSLSGMISVRFVIYPDGTVGEVELKDDWWSVDAAADVTDSLLAHIEQWTFPPGAERPLAINQPWKFEP